MTLDLFERLLVKRGIYHDREQLLRDYNLACNVGIWIFYLGHSEFSFAEDDERHANTMLTIQIMENNGY